MQKPDAQTTRLRDELEAAVEGGHYPQTTAPLPRHNLDLHVAQRIQERMNLGHLYLVEPGPDGPEAIATEAAAASIWRVVQDAIQEAGWKVCT